MKTLVLDVETTGLPPKGADYEKDFMSYPYIVSLAYKVGDEETRYFIINQEGRKIPPGVTVIHGITDEMCAASPHKIKDVLFMLLLEAYETTITAGHNIYFDSSTIKANVLRMIEEGSICRESYASLCILLHKDRRVDTMQSTTKFCNIPGPRGLKWPKLTELHEKLFGESFEAHNSKNDVDATHKCLNKLIELGVIKIGNKEVQSA